MGHLQLQRKARAHPEECGACYLIKLYLMRTDILIQDNISTISGLKIMYDDCVIANLSTTTIAFWNNGSETIDDRDRVISNPLRISTSKTARVLNAKIIFTNNQSNHLSVETDDEGNNIYLLFDYLDKDQGGIIQVIHTGKSSRDLSITGDVKGAIVQECMPFGRYPWAGMIGFTPLIIGLGLLMYVSIFTLPLDSLFVAAFPIAVSAILPLTSYTAYKKWRQAIISPLPKSFRGFLSS